MVNDFLNPTIFWEHDVTRLDPEEWVGFIVKQVFNRDVVSQTAAIPSLLAYYGQERVELLLRQEEWLTSAGIQTARRYFPHLGDEDFKASSRIERRKQVLARAGEDNPKL